MINDINGYSNSHKINNKIRVKYRDMVKFLNYKGYYQYRQSNSTHIVFKNDKGKTVPVPNKKNKTMCQGTVSAILKQINSNRNELAHFLNS